MEIRKTDIFVEWFDNLRDSRARTRIIARLDRMEMGNFGDVRPVGGGVNELRIHYGPGYRLYFVRRGPTVVILLCGGDKKTQHADIAKAKILAGMLED